MGIEYAQEKTAQAVLEFLGDGPLRHRLQHAGETLVRLEKEDFPPQLQGRFLRMKDTLTARGPGPEGRGALEHTSMGMSDEELRDAAERVLFFFAEVHAAAEPFDPGSNPQADGGQE